MKKSKKIIGILTVVLLDQISKIIIMNTMKLNSSVSLIKGFFRLTYTHNYGAAFGLFDGKTAFILIISFLVLLYLLFELFRKKKSPAIMDIGIIMLIGGLIGNLIDRMYFGYVRDFLDFTIFKWDFAIFNLGDTSIVIGAILFLIGIIVEESNANKNNE